MKSLFTFVFILQVFAVYNRCRRRYIRYL